MTIAERSGSLVPLLRILATDRGVVDELVDAARSCSADVARLPLEESRRHVAVLLAAGLAAFERPADLSAHDFAEATRLGADRAAQGVPLGALLHGVQAARVRAFEIAIDRGRTAGIADQVLLEAALELDRYVGALESHVIDGYRAAELELVRTTLNERTNLLRRLLLGEPAGTRPGEQERFGLPAAGRYHCVVSDVSEPARLRELEQRWSAGGGLFGTVEGALAGLTPRPPSTETVDPSMLVVVGPAEPLARARAGYELCAAALRAAARFGRRGLHGVTDLAGETALARQPRLAGLLSDALLGALNPANEFHRELASTVLAYLDHGQRLDHTAAALHVHPNTIRYRLRRLRELTGMPQVAAEGEERLTVLQMLRWWWALHTWLDRSGRSVVR